MKIKVFILLLISVLFIWGNQLDDALNLIEENEHGKARNLLNDFISNNTNSYRLVEAYIGLYKTFTWKYSFDNKIILADSISSMFPFEKHTNIMRIETANYFITQSEYFEASKWLMEIIMFTNKNNSNYNTAINRVKRYINSYLEPAQIEYMLYNYSVETLFPLMLFRLYAINFENSEFEKAEYFRQKLIIEHPESFYTREYILEMESATGTGIKIAILLPTTGEFAPFGESVRKGIVIAKDEDDIDYVIFNTFSNPIRTAKVIDSIYKDKSFIAVIGPVSSMETTAAGAYLFDGKVLPILVPVATNGELMNFGKNIFLINKTLIEQARFTADYVANDDSIKSVGIIFPDDSYGRTLATAFSDEALKKGVNIPFEISYIPGTTDFTDKLNVIIEMNIDAIYLPVSPEDAILLSTQMMYYDINTLLLGSDSWHNEDLVRLAKDYIQNTLIFVPKRINKYSERYINFKLKFRKKYNVEPDRFAMLSYDTFNLLARLIKNGYNTRRSIISYLQQMEYYDGISGKVSFSKFRSDFDVFTINGSDFVIKEIK